MKKSVPKEQRRNYQNGTYVRVTVYPSTREIIKRKAKEAGVNMVDWVEKVIKKADA